MVLLKYGCLFVCIFPSVFFSRQMYDYSVYIFRIACIMTWKITTNQIEHFQPSEVDRACRVVLNSRYTKSGHHGRIPPSIAHARHAKIQDLSQATKHQKAIELSARRNSEGNQLCRTCKIPKLSVVLPLRTPQLGRRDSRIFFFFLFLVHCYRGASHGGSWRGMSIDSRVSDECERNSSHNFRNFLLIGVLLYFFFFFSQYHDIWCYVPRVPRRVRLEAGGKCLPLNRQLTEPRVRWKVSSFCFGWFQVPGEFIVYPSANSINVGDYYSAPRRQITTTQFNYVIKTPYLYRRHTTYVQE